MNNITLNFPKVAISRTLIIIIGLVMLFILLSPPYLDYRLLNPFDVIKWFVTALITVLIILYFSKNHQVKRLTLWLVPAILVPFLTYIIFFVLYWKKLDKGTEKKDNTEKKDTLPLNILKIVIVFFSLLFLVSSTILFSLVSEYHSIYMQANSDFNKFGNELNATNKYISSIANATDKNTYQEAINKLQHLDNTNITAIQDDKLGESTIIVKSFPNIYKVFIIRDNYLRQNLLYDDNNSQWYQELSKSNPDNKLLNAYNAKADEISKTYKQALNNLNESSYVPLFGDTIFNDSKTIPYIILIATFLITLFVLTFLFLIKNILRRHYMATFGWLFMSVINILSSLLLLGTLGY